jgi:hypothetical protein
MNNTSLQDIITICQSALSSGVLTQQSISQLSNDVNSLSIGSAPQDGWDLTPGNQNVVANGGITAGSSCEADGPNTIVMGLGCYGHNAAFIAGRYSNVGTPSAPADDAIALGAGQQVYGDNGFACGWNNIAQADRGFVTGHRGRDRKIELAHVVGYGGMRYLGDNAGPIGEAQRLELGLRQITTGATTTPLTSANDLILRYDTLLVLPDNSTLYVKGMVVAREPSTGQSRAWDFVALAVRGVGPGSVVVTSTVVNSIQMANTAAWALTVTADTNLGALTLLVNGVAGHTIHWVARLLSIESVSL